MSSIYLPSDDSYLLDGILKDVLPKELEKNSNLSFLEIGPGSGILLRRARKANIKNILGADINPDAVRHCQELGFNCIYSNLFQNIPQTFDVIIFNPPYLPDDEDEPDDSKIITTGGKKGSELTNKFLREAKEHLNPEGKIFLVTSSHTRGINWGPYKKRKLAEQKLFFEKLYVWELTL